MPSLRRTRRRYGICLALAACLPTLGQSLPGAYFPLLESGAAAVQKLLDAEPKAGLRALEAHPGWRHFPYAILAPAVLYSKQHPQNRRYRDAGMRALAIRIGDLLAASSEQAVFGPRPDSDWDTYMWLEAYRLLEPELGPERAARWKRELLKNIVWAEPRLRERIDFPGYSSTYVGTSPNHYALYAVNLFLGGRVFGNREWLDLGTRVLHRFAAEEQTEDGFWGEHTRRGPATGYNYVTLSAVALYSEYSEDPDALKALRRATDFHSHFTFLDGTPVDVINDRNRLLPVDPWGHFGFSRFPDGRRYAEFLAGFFDPANLDVESVGRLAQDALYYHEGPTASIPQDRQRDVYQMHSTAGIRKSGPWQICLSGIIDSPPIGNQFMLDRQGHVSVFHRKLGLIISGANSKRQPELATFQEKLLGQIVHMPLTSRLVMGDQGDRLSLAFNTFFSELEIAEPASQEVALRFWITGKYEPPEEARLTLQLRLHPGEELETGSGRKLAVSGRPWSLDGAALNGSIRHHGWTLKVPASASLRWPVYPFNPYADKPETSLDAAVAALSVPVVLHDLPQQHIRPRELEIPFVLSVP